MTTLADPAKKEIAMQLVSSAENSSLNWRAQYGYIEDINDGRGYTGGIIGFTSATGDMLQVVSLYGMMAPKAGLLKFLPALRKVNGTAVPGRDSFHPLMPKTGPRPRPPPGRPSTPTGPPKTPTPRPKPRK